MPLALEGTAEVVYGLQPGLATLVLIATVCLDTPPINDSPCDMNKLFGSERPQPDERYVRTFDPTLEAVTGNTVKMALKLRNTTNWTQTLILGGSPPHYFVVTTTDCEAVWSRPKVFFMAVFHHYLVGDEEKSFTGEWERVDDDGQPVAPGEYLMHVVLNIAEPDSRLVMFSRVEVSR